MKCFPRSSRIVPGFLLSLLLGLAAPRAGRAQNPSSQRAAEPQQSPRISAAPPQAPWVNPSVPRPDADGWATLFDGTNLFGCHPTNAVFSSGKVFIQNHGLWVENTGLEFDWRARNVALRARVRKVSGQNVSLRIGPYMGWFNGGNSFGIGRFRDRKYTDLSAGRSARNWEGFVDMELRMVGSQVVLLAGGAVVAQAQSAPPEGEAAVRIGALRGIGVFATIQAKALDSKDQIAGDSPEAKPGPAERLKQLKTLLEQGLISKEDYDKKVKEVLDSL
jgi:hypothetical protein